MQRKEIYLTICIALVSIYFPGFTLLYIDKKYEQSLSEDKCNTYKKVQCHCSRNAVIYMHVRHYLFMLTKWAQSKNYHELLNF